MEQKSKFDYEVEAFEKAFADKKDKRIALYGTGRMTATLLERLRGFNIVGVLDKNAELAGSRVYGKEVLDRKKAESAADIIVINTSEAYWSSIYQRIADWQIPVYYRNGELACKKAAGFEDNEYWAKNIDALRKMIAQADVVSFDVFDTLLMRRVSDSMDVFRIVEKSLRDRYGDGRDFAQCRKKAAGAGDNATLEEIYDAVQELSGADADFIDCAMRTELAVEKSLVIPRTAVADLCRKALKNKDVYLVSDMYFPRAVIHAFLTNADIDVDEDRIIVSCEHRKSKQDGSLWEYFSKEIVKGRYAIHIGDDPVGDVAEPEKFGIRTYGLWGAYKLVENSYLRDIAACVHSTFESVLLGVLAGRICSDPFCFHKSRGKLVFANERDAGFVLLGPVVHTFCRWLFEQAEKDRIDQLLFFAREGWFVKRFFSEYCDAAGVKPAAELVYLETSRRAVMTASIRSKEDIAEIAAFPYRGDRNEFFHDRFGIDVPDADKPVEFYADAILEEAGRERKNYLRYLDTLGIKENCAIVDSQLYGSTQFFLGRMLGRRFRGYYFCVCLDESNRYLSGNIMKGCFCWNEGTSSSIYKNAPFIESFFTAPNGMMECVNDDGTIRHRADGENQRHFHVREEMAEGIVDYIREVERIRKDTGISYEGSSDWADKAFAVLMQGAFEPTPRMREGFFYDNGIAGRNESALWG